MPSRPLPVLTLCVGLLSCASPQAQETAAPDEPCAGFAWSLRREQAWLFAPGIGRIVPDDALTAAMPAAVLGLRRYAAARLPHPPTREPKPDSFAAAIHAPTPAAPGLYQVTLSDHGWVDLFQDGEAKKPLAHTGRANCPGLRKSLRYRLDAKPVVIQITGASAETIRIAFAPVETER